MCDKEWVRVPFVKLGLQQIAENKYKSGNMFEYRWTDGNIH